MQNSNWFDFFAISRNISLSGLFQQDYYKTQGTKD